MDLIELKQLLDENRNRLSEILRESRNGSTEQALLDVKMSSLLEEFAEIEEQLFADTTDPKEKSTNSVDC